jgi:hypothetical protein
MRATWPSCLPAKGAAEFPSAWTEASAGGSLSSKDNSLQRPVAFSA